MADYIPAPDAEFNAWQGNFLSYATANAAALGLDPLVDIPPLTAAQTVWTTDFPAHVTAANTAQSAKVTKDAARAGYVSLIRALVRRLQASAAVGSGDGPHSFVHAARPAGVGAQRGDFLGLATQRVVVPRAARSHSGLCKPPRSRRSCG